MLKKFIFDDNFIFRPRKKPNKIKKRKKRLFYEGQPVFRRRKTEKYQLRIGKTLFYVKYKFKDKHVYISCYYEDRNKICDFMNDVFKRNKKRFVPRKCGIRLIYYRFRLSYTLFKKYFDKLYEREEFTVRPFNVLQDI